MTDPANCPFCKRIAEGEFLFTGMPSVVRFEPLNPVTPGHMLFVPRIHLPDAASIPTVTGQVFAAASHYAQGVNSDFNLITSKGSTATQTVMHLHIHYVPRCKDDNLHLPWTGQVKS